MTETVKEYTLAASLGAVLYGLIEIAVRGRTHWTMLAAGGAAFLLIYLISTDEAAGSAAECCAFCFVVMTATEFITGCVVNRMFGLGVWDYSGRRLNIMGQICPEFCFGWLVLSCPARSLCRFLRREIRGREKQGR